VKGRRGGRETGRSREGIGLGVGGKDGEVKVGVER